MEAYVKHQFHAHLHVPSVITRHLVANFIKPDRTTKAKYASMEAKVAALATKEDSLTAKLALYVDKEKGKAKQDKENKEKSKKNQRESRQGRVLTGPPRSLPQPPLRVTPSLAECNDRIVFREKFQPQIQISGFLPLQCSSKICVTLICEDWPA
jgi:hypothetical protein